MTVSPHRGTRIAAMATGLLIGLWSSSAVEIRWAQSSNRIYVAGTGTVTLSEIKAALDRVPLEEIAPAVWHLRANLVIEEGARLVLHGTSLGGDVNELRLQSNNTKNAGLFVFVSADSGSIHIQSTTISSWDDAVSGPDTEYAAFGRAYIGVRSRLAPDGVTPLESRMDVIDSDVGYLGYDEAEAYGLSWKVVGTHPDPGRSIYDLVNVYGDILNSRLHHNFFGVYTFGHQGGRWADNEVDHNVGYGFDPHDDSDHVVIERNHVRHNGWDGIIASLRCDHLTIRSNICSANGQNGIILHRNSNDAIVENNQCLSNGTAGIVLAGAWRCVVRSNLVVGNLEAGIRLNLGSADNVIEGNECASNVRYGLRLYKGSDEPEPDDDGRPKRNSFRNNLVRDNGMEGINLAESDDNIFATNIFHTNSDTLRFELGSGNRLDGNDISEEVVVITFGSVLHQPVTYITDQRSLRVQVDLHSSIVFEDRNGRIFDPEVASLATSVTAGGSTLTLTAADIGTSSMGVAARGLWVEATEGTVLVNPTAWTRGGDSARQWVTRAPSAMQRLTYTVSRLDRNRVYTVRKAGAALTTLNSDPSGRITFMDVAGATNEVAYIVEPGAQVFLERGVDTLVVSWTGGGGLQRATRLSPPNWQDVPITNGQFSIRIKTVEPMEFFKPSQTEGNFQ